MTEKLNNLIYHNALFIEKSTRYLMYLCIFLAAQIITFTILYFITLFIAADIIHSPSMVRIIVSVFDLYACFVSSYLDLIN